MQQKLILLAREKVTPQTLLVTDDKIGVVLVACPGEGCWFRGGFVSSQNKFAAFEHEPDSALPRLIQWK